MPFLTNTYIIMASHKSQNVFLCLVETMSTPITNIISKKFMETMWNNVKQQTNNCEVSL